MHVAMKKPDDSSGERIGQRSWCVLPTRASLSSPAEGSAEICVTALKLGIPLKLRDAVGHTITCHAGTVWITQENDARDIYLAAGESFAFDRPGLALINAEEGMKDEWLSDTGVAVISGPASFLRQRDSERRIQRRPSQSSEDREDCVAQEGSTTVTWTRTGLACGARLARTAVPVMALFGVAFGAYAAQKGITLLDAMLMSTLTFAGASQFVAAEIWAYPMTAAALLTLLLLTATVNMRFMLMTASLRPWVGGLSGWQTYPALSLMTEPGWLIALRYRAAGGTDPAMLLGSGVALWFTWIASTGAGYALGSFVAEPQRYGLDVVMPVFFTVMLVPLWKGGRLAMAWLAAGAVSLSLAAFVPGWWHVVAGALAGSVFAGILSESD
jgi:branched chain amino acid efflux pump